MAGRLASTPRTSLSCTRLDYVRIPCRYAVTHTGPCPSDQSWSPSKADRAWHLANPARHFSPSHHLPSHWASQVIGHNVTVSMALLHLQLAIAWSQPLPSLHRYPVLAVAAPQPSLSRPRQLYTSCLLFCLPFLFCIIGTCPSPSYTYTLTPTL